MNLREVTILTSVSGWRCLNLENGGKVSYRDLKKSNLVVSSSALSIERERKKNGGHSARPLSSLSAICFGHTIAWKRPPARGTLRPRVSIIASSGLTDGVVWNSALSHTSLQTPSRPTPLSLLLTRVWVARCTWLDRCLFTYRLYPFLVLSSHNLPPPSLCFHVTHFVGGDPWLLKQSSAFLLSLSPPTTIWFTDNHTVRWSINFLFTSTLIIHSHSLIHWSIYLSLHDNTVI